MREHDNHLYQTFHLNSPESGYILHYTHPPTLDKHRYSNRLHGPPNRSDRRVVFGQHKAVSQPYHCTTLLSSVNKYEPRMTNTSNHKRWRNPSLLFLSLLHPLSLSFLQLTLSLFVALSGAVSGPVRVAGTATSPRTTGPE